MAASNWKEMIDSIHDNDLNSVQYYLDAGVNVNYQHPEYLTTPLITSIELRHYDIIKLLLEHGADPSQKAGFSNDTPLLVAKRLQDQQIVSLLKSYLPAPRNLWERVKTIFT